MTPRNLDPEAAAAEMAANPNLQRLDVRQDWEYEQAHIAGVTLIPLDELEQRHTELRVDQPVLCICAGGVRSEKAAKYLLAQGFSEVLNMTEGMKGWQSRGLPTERS